MNKSVFLQQNLRIIFAIAAFISPIAGIFSFLTSAQTIGSFIHGFIDGLCVSVLLGVYIVFFSHNTSLGFMGGLSFLQGIVVDVLAYLAAFFIGRMIGQLFFYLDFNETILNFFLYNFKESFVFAMIVSLLVNVILRLCRLIGYTTFINFLFGKYHKPIEEEMIFLFVDLKNSTPLAERLGNKYYHMFLNQFFHDVSAAVLASQGDIYEYVGDEVKIAWKKRNGVKSNNCLECFFLIQKIIRENGKKYQDQFEVSPEFRGSIHGGTVIAGEIGNIKQKIAFVGDVLNCSGRMIEYCRQNNLDVVISEDVVGWLPWTKDYSFEELATVQLRGKDRPMKLYHVLCAA